jgi:small subunit ribosomal protein S21|tara:strand:+ start:595 stop:798 length:204 start_codon:yes stop_codon:yes gene_type:complete
MKIDVRNNNVDKALKILKKKLQEDGVFNEIREREFYMTKGEKKRKSLAAAIRRDQKIKQKRFEEFGY